MSDFKGGGTGDDSGRSQVERKQSQLLSDLSKSIDMQHHNTSLMHEFGSAFDAPANVSTGTSGPGNVGVAPSPARSDHQHGPEVPTFVYPTLLNSWVNYTPATWCPVRYYKMNGRVWLEGFITSGSTFNATMFFLDAGYRPYRNVTWATVSNNAISRILVQTDGQVNQEAIGTTGWISLHGNWLPA